MMNMRFCVEIHGTKLMMGKYKNWNERVRDDGVT